MSKDAMKTPRHYEDEYAMKIPKPSYDEHVTEYWLEHYATDVCTLCGNHGVIDTRGVKSPNGIDVGRLNYCICPNGQALRLVCWEEDAEKWAEKKAKKAGRLEEVIPF